MRIDGTENTAQYSTNLGSQKSANVTRPISVIKSAQCGKLKVRVRPGNGSLKGRKSELLRQTMLEAEKPESGPAMALYWAESRLYSGKPGCKSKS